MNLEKLFALGYSNILESERIMNGYDELLPARIMAQHRSMYVLSDGEREFNAQITGRMMFSASSREDYPAVGDWVLVEMTDESHAVIKNILPRNTVLRRKKSGRESEMQIIASNIDMAFIMLAPDRDYNLNRIERYMSMASAGDIESAIILNKTDLLNEEEVENKKIELRGRFPDTDIYMTSTQTSMGLEALGMAIKKSHTYCFIGSSGVGKSSVINLLMGNEVMKTGHISQSAERGKHVTTHRQLFMLNNGGMLIDTPGMREIAVMDSEQGIDQVFTDIEELARNCRYANCSHTHEPGCAVREAVDEGEIDEQQYKNFLKLRKEDTFNTMSNIQRRQKQRQFSKHLKNYNKERD